MEENKGNPKRTYNKINDEQRSMLIEIMSQNEHISIKDASSLLSINYENAKRIWIIYRAEGRKHSLKDSKKPATTCQSLAKTSRACDQTVLG